MITNDKIDPAELNAVVRKAEADTSFEILECNVQTLSTGGATNPDGLLRVSGVGRSSVGVKPWAVVLKVVKPTEWEAAPCDLGYWRREGEAYATGVLASLPGPVRAAQCYGVSEHEDRMWIWMELLADRSGRDWDLADYAYAAEQVGRFNAACAADPSISSAPWMTRDHARSWHRIMNFEHAWHNERVRQAFPAPMQQRLENVWLERERFYAALNRLPQVFSHYDYKSRNLFLHPRADGQQEVIAVDWGDCGIGALGGDLALLVSGSCFFMDWEREKIAGLDLAAYSAYIQGLHSGGWQGDETQVRLSYLAWSALYFGPPLVPMMEFLLNDDMKEAAAQLLGYPLEKAASSLLALAEFTLDCADEARQLMTQFDL